MIQRAAAFILLLTASLAAGARDLPLDRIKLPPGFTISLYADDVPGARSMALSPDGTLFVGTRGSKVYALPNRKNGKQADEVIVLADKLKGRVREPYFFVSAASMFPAAALAAVALARGQTPAPVEFAAAPGEIAARVEAAARALGEGQRWVRGIYAGGTLAWEARELLAARLADVAPGVDGGASGHRVVDFGGDAFTLGRPHPMLDGTIRREWIEREAADPAAAVLLLDVIQGFGAHPDPAGELLPALRAARRRAEAEGRALAVVASVTGTEEDLQPRSTQISALEAAGVLVMPSNAQAARLAAAIAATRA